MISRKESFRSSTTTAEMKQKSLFLQSEGDAWHARNHQAVANRQLPDSDALLQAVIDLIPVSGGGVKILEVGCGDGTRLAWLKSNFKADCFGIEPSAQAVASARIKGLEVQQGAADSLPFMDGNFDIVIFGFCLYLCDREDLFQIAKEADRVLMAPGWLVLLDFYSPVPRSNPYHHRPGIHSYKMDYRTLFTWHPHYECIGHKVTEQGGQQHTDLADKWVAVSVLRKCQPASPI